MPDRAPSPASSTASTSTWASASAASAASSPATSRTATPRRSTGGASARSKAACIPNASALVPVDGLQPLRRADLPEGCPVDAYTKDPVTGIVRHSADACIGCQYCTWNCSYGVPQYNPERGVVGKCDMCHGRLELGQAPACVSACPEGAIAIEIVNIAEWRAAVATAARRPRRARRRRQPVDDARDAAGAICRRTRGRVDLTHVDARAPALAAGRHDGADAAVGRRVRHDLAAAAARRGRRGSASRRSRRSLVGGLALARVDAASRPAGPRLSRAEDVAAIVAEPRGAAVRARSPASPALYAGAAVVRAAGRRWRRRR